VLNLYKIGSGIFNVDGDEWLHQRKLAAKIFTAKNFKQFVETTFNKHTKALLNSLENALQERKQVDLSALFHRLTLDTFSEIAFDGECRHGDLTERQRRQKSEFALAFDRAQIHVGRRVFFTPFTVVLERIFNWGNELNASVQLMRNYATEVYIMAYCP
jgi:cytochrome P450